MKATVDSGGRILIPKALRDALGVQPGTEVDISFYGGGIQIVPGGRSATVILEDGVPVIAGTTPIDDDVVFALIDAGRR